jgi:hypothetical protein
LGVLKQYVMSIGISIFIAGLLGAITWSWNSVNGTTTTEEECSTVPASDPEFEGWTIETCGNEEQTWIKPDGTRCVANEAAGTTECEDSIPMQVG